VLWILSMGWKSFDVGLTLQPMSPAKMADIDFLGIVRLGQAMNTYPMPTVQLLWYVELRRKCLKAVLALVALHFLV
jgi:uncharacterized membrane protein YfbV (UPF0208 family)